MNIDKLTLELEEKHRFTSYKLPRKKRLKLIEEIKNLLSEEKNITAAVIYGSFLRFGKEFRDVDIAVFTSQEVEDNFRYEQEIEEKVVKLVEKSGLKTPIEVRIINSAPSWFKLEVLETGTIIVEKIPGLLSTVYKVSLEEVEGIKLKGELCQRFRVHQEMKTFTPADETSTHEP